MRSYDVIAILNTQGDQSLDACKNAFESILERFGAKTEKEEDWGERRLQYEVQDVRSRQRFRSGHFLYRLCKIDPTKITDISRELDIDGHILRHMFRRGV